MQRTVRIYKIKDHQYNTIKIELLYDRGGMNYITGQNVERGYYISANPSEENNGWSRWVAFSGTKTMIKPAKRYSQKIFESLDYNEELEFVLQDVLKKNGIKKENLTLVYDENQENA